MAGNWNDDDKRAVAEAFKTLMLALNTYGKDDMLKERLRAFQIILESKYTGQQVAAAMITHASKAKGMPEPADLIKIISPPEPRITQDEYRNALEQHKAEGYPMFGYYGGIIKKYKEQQAGDGSVSSTYTEILQQCQNSANALQNVAKRLTNEQ